MADKQNADNRTSLQIGRNAAREVMLAVEAAAKHLQWVCSKNNAGTTGPESKATDTAIAVIQAAPELIAKYVGLLNNDSPTPR